ncbi:MAG: IS110 family transposase [Sandaracinaceae bacterium]|nr:IS110 family transposase [Sandaracinaceae bacterium]
MRYIGIDIGSEVHAVAAVGEEEEVVLKPTKVAETGAGHEQLLKLLGEPAHTLVVMEATGHYWQNLFARLATAGFKVAVVNPLAVRRFGESHLTRAKTDAVDALLIARLGRAHRPAPAALPDENLQELQEHMRLRDRWVQDLGDRVRQLHRLVDLGFPELTQHVKDLSSSLATTLLSRCPTAAAFRQVKPSTLAKLKYDGRRHVPEELAKQLVAAAKSSAGMHHGTAYRLGVVTSCEDIDVLRKRVADIDRSIRTLLEGSELASLLQTIDGIGPTTAARLMAEFGDPAQYRTAAAFTAHFGVVPAVHHSGKSTPSRAAATCLGDARLRAKLWMPTLAAVLHNSWLKHFYDGLLARGKPAKLALVASMRKLLTAVYSVAKSRKPFVPRLPTPSAQTP